MNLDELGALLASLAERLASGAESAELGLVLVPEARMLRLRLACRDGAAEVQACVATTPDEHGTCRTLVRGTVEQVGVELASPALVEHLRVLTDELMRAAAWTEQMLLPRSADVPSLPGEAVLEARRNAVRDALLALVELPPPWLPVVSVSLPGAWPLVRGTELVSYLAATRAGAGPTLFEHSHVLARAHHDAVCRAPLRTELLSSEVSSAGTAAVMPIAASEIEGVRALPPLGHALATIVVGIPEPQLTATLCGRYRFERRRAGWLYELTRPLHAAFWSWIDQACPDHRKP